MTEREPASPVRAARLYALLLAAGWIFMVSVSLALGVWTMLRAHHERMRLQAAIAIEDDARYREWLAESPVRRVPGVRPTASPHEIQRRVQKMHSGDIAYPERRHLIGFSGPFCDPWERMALEGFKRGESEAGARVKLNGVEYFRLMRPLHAEPSCLKCHRDFQPGELCGAAVVGVPTEPLWAIQRRRIRGEVLTHVILGTFVLALIGFVHLRLEDNLKKLRVLKGILPICSFCKNIRDESGDWQQMESYVREHSHAIFSHALCANCFEKQYPEYHEDARKRGER